MNYTGWRSDGMMFDSTIARARRPRSRSTSVMAGWRECVLLMTIGEKRRCWIPAGARLPRSRRAADRNGRLRHRADRDASPSPPIPPPDVKAPPEDAKRTATGLAYKVLRPGKGTRSPSPFSTGQRALHGMDDRRPHVRQLGPARQADDDASLTR